MRRLLVGAFALALLTVTCVTASGGVAPSSVHVRFHEVVSGLSSPVAVTSARDGSRRLFVVQQGGTVRVVRNGQLRSQTYLDLGGRLVSGGEQGLLSIAFHRHFGRHPFVYAAYTRAGDGALVVSRFRAASADATSVAKSTERHLLTVPHPEQTNHNGGQLLFGRHGYLYITTGDGGGAGDPFANAENLNSLSGKVLRINVNRSCGQKHYCIPQGNPFAHSSTKKRQIFDWGLRNPWRMSVDRATGRLWIADVGQDVWEEIDHVRQVGGKDFGWSCREGRASYNSGRCSINGSPRHMTGPAHVYNHDNGGCAVIGGFDYQGPNRPFAHGLYVYGDYCSGEVWALGQSGGSWHNAKVGDIGSGLTAFGEGDSGELYAVTQGGTLYHAVFVHEP
jgi:glucose/arabinose dehydrogenase